MGFNGYSFLLINDRFIDSSDSKKIKFFMTCLCTMCEWGEKNCYKHKGMSDSWWRADMCKCVCVCDPSPITHRGWSEEWKLTTLSDLFVRCTSGEIQQPSVSHTAASNAGIQMHTRKKKNCNLPLLRRDTPRLGVFLPSSPSRSLQLCLYLFSQVCQCHLGLCVIFYPSRCLSGRGVLALWESKQSAQIIPLPLRYSAGSGQQSVTYSTVKNCVYWKNEKQANRFLSGVSGVSTWETVTVNVSPAGECMHGRSLLHMHSYHTDTQGRDGALGPFISRPGRPHSSGIWGLQELYSQKYEPMVCMHVSGQMWEREWGYATVNARIMCCLVCV